MAGSPEGRPVFSMAFPFLSALLTDLSPAWFLTQDVAQQCQGRSGTDPNFRRPMHFHYAWKGVLRDERGTSPLWADIYRLCDMDVCHSHSDAAGRLS